MANDRKIPVIEVTALVGVAVVLAPEVVMAVTRELVMSYILGLALGHRG